MAGVYRPRHPERTVLYRVLFHHFDRFLTEYEARFERESIVFLAGARGFLVPTCSLNADLCGFSWLLTAPRGR